MLDHWFAISMYNLGQSIYDTLQNENSMLNFFLTKTVLVIRVSNNVTAWYENICQSYIQICLLLSYLDTILALEQFLPSTISHLYFVMSLYQHKNL